MALLAVAPALTPDAALAMPVGRAFGLLGARMRMSQRNRKQAAAAGRGGGDSLFDRYGDGDVWTDGKGRRHTKINTMASLYALMPRKPGEQ